MGTFLISLRKWGHSSFRCNNRRRRRASRCPRRLLQRNEECPHLRGASEDELVAAHAPATGAQFLELETALAEKSQDLLRLRYLEGITTQPVEHVTPQRHAALELSPAGRCTHQPAHAHQVR